MSIDNKLILENSKKLNVLYIEDDNFLRHTTLKLLLNFFNSVDESIDGRDGLEKYNSYYEDTNSYYDIVISDINMPNLDGIDMVEEVKSINSQQVVIFITAFD